jgi:hypothetical protein
MWLIDQGEKCIVLAVLAGLVSLYTNWNLAGQVALAMVTTGVVLCVLGAVFAVLTDPWRRP